jgi:iron complex outermembrane receptor protein
LRARAPLIFVAVAILYASRIADAQLGPEAPDATAAADAVAPEVVAGGISSTGSFESGLDTTGFVEIIDASDAWRGYRTIGDLVEHSVGLRVRHFGSREDSSTLSVRGSTASQVKILVDGVSMNRADNAIVDLADLPVDIVERIEVYRGFTPVRFASSGASSVINIVTRTPETSRSAGSLSIGSFKTGKVSLQASEPTDAGTLSGFLTFRRTDGDFEFLDDKGTDQNPSDDQRVDRKNNDLESWDLLLRYRGDETDAGRVTVSGSTYYKDEGAPGLDTPQSPVSRFRQWRSILSAAWEHPDGYRAQLDGTVVDQTLNDPVFIEDQVDISLGFPYESADSLTLGTTLQLGASRVVGKRHFLEAGIEAGYEQIDENFHVTSGKQSELQQRTGLAIAVGDEIYFSRTRISVAPQLRYESIWNHFDLDQLVGPPIPVGDLPSDRDDSLDPRLGLRWDATPELALKANASTYFRPPSFGELFGDAGFSASNPALSAETGKSADIGLLAHYGDIATLEYAYFVNDIDDMIVFLSSGGGIPRPQNIGKAEIRGHELRLQLQHSGGLSLDANFTVQDPENRTPFPETIGKQLPSVPEHEGFIRLSVDRRHWGAEYEMDYRGRVFLDPVNDDRVSSRFLHTVRLIGKPVPADFRIELEARNLSDEQSRDVVGFPVPGRAFFVTFSYARQSTPRHGGEQQKPE